jgi:hypothetical protein
MSDTAALAADTASLVPSWGACAVRSIGALGSNRTTTLSQNAARRRNLMTLPFIPCGCFSRRIAHRLANSLEGQVGGEPPIFRKFAANARHILIKFEMSRFD